jgi:hypothetical protein
MITSISASFSWSALRADKLSFGLAASLSTELVSAIPTIVISTSTSTHSLAPDAIPSAPSGDDFVSATGDHPSRALASIDEEEEEECSAAYQTYQQGSKLSAITEEDEEDDPFSAAPVPISAESALPVIAEEDEDGSCDVSYDPEVTLIASVSSSTKLFDKISQIINSGGDIAPFLEEIRAL